MKTDNRFLSLLKRFFPHCIAIILFYILTIAYFSPYFFDGQVLPQGDMVSGVGMTKEVVDFYKETGIKSGWTNSMFSGMPTETMYGDPGFNFFLEMMALFRGGLPYNDSGILFTYLICFYIFMLLMGASPWLSIVGAIGFSLASYNIIIIEAGHVTKAYAMAYLAPMIGGIILTFRKKYLLGGSMTLLFAGMLIMSNHLQVTYYALIMALVLGVAYFFYYLFRKKELRSFFKAIGVLVIAAVFAVLPNMVNIYPTYEYSKDTMRGGSVLTIHPEHKSEQENVPHAGGLEIDYAYAWSYGKMESFTMLVPNMYGGGHVMLEPGDETLRELKKEGYGSPYLPTYWGEQPFTSGPVYVGAIIVFLFVLGLFVVKGPEKWFALVAVVISLILAWGKNFEAINNFLFYNLPFYNKFRTPSMALIIAGTVMPMLGMMALKQIFQNEIDKEKAWKKTWISAAIVGGLIGIVMLFGLSASYTGSGDASFQNQLSSAGFQPDQVDSIHQILKEYRKSMLFNDAFRSLIFVLLSLGGLYLYLKGKVKQQNYIIALLGILILVDMWAVDRRYLNEKNFQSERKAKSHHKATEADQLILQDPDINYRVLNLSVNTFNDASTSYHHKSIGGYSPAKLRRYQDLIDFYLNQEKIYQPLTTLLMREQAGETTAPPQELNVINMLNTKYFILPVGEGKVHPFLNRHAYGNAWNVKGVKFVNNPDEEILALGTTNLKDSAVVEVINKEHFTNKEIQFDSSGTIKNTQCDPNYLVYETSFNKEQLVVFSEIFYITGGWTAYIDGKEVPHFRANYMLRAMFVPAGEHKVEFKYVPYARNLAKTVGGISSTIVILIFLSALGYSYWEKRKKSKTA
ncbi:MAG TPA: YfhO family protein [Bacteroidales bacterium]|nr:YfhO family protein [Bacteroidales bacterium]HOH22902.1 YfhO family protein [Bacteroidales bacterium]HPZ04163.1 YfhO family protein [Bacteroidales bacterium]HQB75630.1 YfhO family protein [Bacteroidales bacterium]